jgi:hypothetical protein
MIIFSACSSKYTKIDLDNRNYNSKEVKKLTNLILSTSNKINLQEAKKFSYDVITFSKYLANEYEIQTTALIHNSLINLNLKKRGFCYHYTNDLKKYLKTKEFKTFKLIKAVSKRDEYFEHTSLVLTRDDLEFKDSIVLDAWRNTGILFFKKIKDDTRYKWEIK